MIVAVLAMIGPFTIDMIFPGFDQMAADFGADTTAMQQVTSLYMVAFAVMSLLHGPLSDALGRKPVIVVGMLLYAGSSAACALAPTLPLLLLARVLQGASAGAGQIISRTVIRDMFHGAAAQRMMAQVAMIFSVAPAVAPILGGVFLGFGHWQLLFWILTGYGLALAAVVAFALPETHPSERRTPLHLTPVMQGLVAIARDAQFLRLAFAAGIGFAAQFLYISAAPIIMLKLLGKGEQDFWILFVPLISGMMLGSWITSRFAGRFPPIRTATVGFAIGVGGGVLNVAINSIPGVGLPWLMVAPPLLALGVAIAFPILQLAMLDRFPQNRGAAASMQAFVSLLFNAGIAGVVAPLVAGSMLEVALGALACSLVATSLWVWYRRHMPADAPRA